MTAENVGLGACPVGTSQAGFGLPAVAAPPVKSLLIKSDGTQGDCAALSPTSGDFILDSYGNKQGDSSLNQCVYLALFTALGSSAVSDVGVEWPSGTIADDLVQKNRKAAALALKPLTDAKLITLFGTQTKRVGPNSVRRIVFWKPVNSSGPVQQTSV